MRIQAILLAGLSLLPAVLARADTDWSAEALFARRVLPTLQAKCFACHGDEEDDVRGELDLRTRAGLLAGGESGLSSIEPGHPEESPLYLSATRDSDDWSAMPPKENDQLSQDEKRALYDWIEQGAPWPSEDRLAALQAADNADGVLVATSGGLSEDWTGRRYDPKNLWAYQPLARWRPTGDAVGNNAIDALINERLGQLEIEPAPPADRQTLIRRASYDLTGLPPTPAEVAVFLNDPRSDEMAFASLVDRLLASPHYGEQAARHWLDVVRYADSAGYSNDYDRGNAWRYRDYVIRAFNRDKPYDKFVREQLAGDELFDAQQSNGGQPSSELLVAPGFLRMGPWELTVMEVAKVSRQRFLDDVTDAVGQVFLGHMLQCARCHDHKFDPVPTRDYYSIQAVFATTQLAERQAEFTIDESQAGFEEKRLLERRGEFYDQIEDGQNKKKTVAAARQWYAERNLDAARFEEALEYVRSNAKPGEEFWLGSVRRRMEKMGVSPEKIFHRHVGLDQRDLGLERVAWKGLERLKWSLDRYEPYALSVYCGPTRQLKEVNAPLRMPENMDEGTIEDTSILKGGDPFSPATLVRPGVLSAVSLNVGDSTGAATSKIPDSLSGRRSALANWIAHRDNPLTARVMVNRIWQSHFGKGIAATPNNFGATGKRPTHPRLLDWLAEKFIDSGWSVKSLHRVIMNTAAYRRSSYHPDRVALSERDPLGISCAVFHPRRLTAEELRDAMLAASGELNPQLCGIPIRPEMNREAAQQPRLVMGCPSEAWQPSAHPSQRHRRSLYALRIRGQRDPFLEVFNAPPSEISCEARNSSTVTPQVFAMFNSEITFDRALAMAQRLLATKASRRQRIDQAFHLVYGRAARRDEIDACLSHWESMTARHQEIAFAPANYPREIPREVVEENTGEKFQFAEPMEVYAEYVADLEPAETTPELRGLAEVCLVLLNSNEFVYVY